MPTEPSTEPTVRPVLARARRRLAGRAGVCASAALMLALSVPGSGFAQGTAPLKERNVGVSREGANKHPRTEGDQALAEGWPLYRTERGQTAFNDAMATLKATEGPAPSPAAFKGCAQLECNLALPRLTADGWLAPGRLWVSPTHYVLVAHSPRNREGRSYRRRSTRDMKYFVFHEFHNSTRNTDTYDTISSHSGAVFVPFYMSKQATDAKGRTFVVVVQVAPYDVASVHATNMGSAGAGIEVAKSAFEALEPLQGLAGALVATMVKAAAPQLKVVNHHGNEGLPMLDIYERRLAAAKARPGGAALALPFVAAAPQRVAAATGRLEELIARRGASDPVPMAERGIAPPRAAAAEPQLVGPIRLARRPAAAAEPALRGSVMPPSRSGNGEGG